MPGGEPQNITFHITADTSEAKQALSELQGTWASNNVSYGGSIGGSGSSLGGFAPMTGIEPWQTPAMPASGSFWSNCNVTGHDINPETLQRDPVRSGYTARCSSCIQTVFIPEQIFSRNLDLEEAGTLLGRAMTLEDEDESVGELVAALANLEGRITTETKRHGRLLKFVKMSRDLIAKRAINAAGGGT